MTAVYILKTSGLSACKDQKILKAEVGQISLTLIRLIMIRYIVPWWPSWLKDQNALRNPESDVVCRVPRLSHGRHLGYLVRTI